MNNFNKKINSIKEKFSNGNNLNFFIGNDDMGFW